MIVIKNTENLAGVTISGDFNDLNQLVEAFHTITIDEYDDKLSNYTDISTRVLGLCYDIRHAMQGDRDITMLENGLSEETMKFHSIIAPRTNVYYSCNYFYPEMFFIMLALNELLELRIKLNSKPKNCYSGALNTMVIWDEAIVTIRIFQSAFMKCVKEVLSEASFTRWLNIMNDNYCNINKIAGQFLDVQNINYLAMSKEQRKKKLSIIAKRIVEFEMNPDHKEITEIIGKAIAEYGCDKNNIRLEGFDYPEEINW